jgi:anaerobic selenocysteine-containing dehydrogenase
VRMRHERGRTRGQIGCNGRRLRPHREPRVAVRQGISRFAIHASPNRLTTPRYRPPGSNHWEDISWESAVERIAQQIRKTRDTTWVATEKLGDAEVPVNRTDAIAFS